MKIEIKSFNFKGDEIQLIKSIVLFTGMAMTDFCSRRERLTYVATSEEYGILIPYELTLKNTFTSSIVKSGMDEILSEIWENRDHGRYGYDRNKLRAFLLENVITNEKRIAFNKKSMAGRINRRKNIISKRSAGKRCMFQEIC